MAERDWLTERFEEHRTRLRAVAYRMLGSLSEADDAVQEAWLRLNGTDAARLQNLSGWLTTVVARISLDNYTGDYIDVKLWGPNGQELAAESLYEED